jgi:hypothetical protein
MKKILALLCVFIFAFGGCSSEGENSVTLNNSAAGTVYLNFRGEVTTVPSGKTVILSKLPQGTFAYITTYSVPAGATSSTEVGDMTGEITIYAGSKILILYSSTFSENSYTIYASRTTSDNLDNPRNPLFP